MQSQGAFEKQSEILIVVSLLEDMRFALVNLS